MQEQTTAQAVTTQVIESIEGLTEGLGAAGAAAWPVLVTETKALGAVYSLLAILLSAGAVWMIWWGFRERDRIERIIAEDTQLYRYAEPMNVLFLPLAGAIAFMAGAAFLSINGAQMAIAPSTHIIETILESLRAP